MLAIAQFFAQEAREVRKDPDLIRARTWPRRRARLEAVQARLG